MKIQVTWTFGNFSVTAGAEIPFTEPVSPLTKSIVEKGFLQLLQRVPASNAEKALAGYEKRPAGFKRDSIPFSEENALALSAAFGTSVEVDEGVTLPFAILDVVEHEGSDGASSRKMATEMAEQVLAVTDPEEIAAMTFNLKKHGYVKSADAETNRASLIEASHKFLAGLRAKPVKKAA